MQYQNDNGKIYVSLSYNEDGEPDWSIFKIQGTQIYETDNLSSITDELYQLDVDLYRQYTVIFNRSFENIGDFELKELQY